jgi:hypothetical protein
MAAVTQLFAGTHAEALARADALDAGEPPGDGVPLGSVDAIDLETLGEIAARAVRFGSGDLELAEVDLDHETLLRLPPFLCDVLAELTVTEDEEVPGEVAEQWAATDDVGLDGADPEALVRALAAAATRAQREGRDLYLWMPGT